MNSRRILLIVAQLVAFAAITQAVTIWILCRSPWTPIERHYLSAYFWSSLPVIGPSTVEVRLIWKTARHRKQQLATDNDAIGSDDGTGMALSRPARDAGWKALIEGPPRQVPADVLSQDLGGLAFEGQSLGDLLFLPELSALAALCTALGAWYLLTGFFRALNVELALRRKHFSTEQPLPCLFEKERVALGPRARSGLAELRLRASRLMALQQHVPRTEIVQSAPPTWSPSFAIPIFGVYNGTGEGYLWSEKDEIE